jgi:hypothetical protein
MNNRTPQRQSRIGVLACALALVAAFGGAAGEPAADKLREEKERAKNRDKWGIYVMVNPDARPKTMSLLRTHPVVRAVVLSYSWAQLEPKKSRYELDGLAAQVRKFGEAGKGVVLALRFYGQDPVEGREIPSWVYRESGLSWVSFPGGGRAQGEKIRIPAVWNPEACFAVRYVEPLVRALARKLDGDPHVWYVQAALGHLGNLTVQPSAGGAEAILRPGSGWSVEAWSRYAREVLAVYRKHFRSTPLMVIDEVQLLRHKGEKNYQAEAARIGRYGAGDDWPLWVPKERRDQGGTRGRDDEFLRRAITFAFGGAGMPRLPTTILLCQLPEALASHPDADGYKPEVRRILKEASGRLQENDMRIFGAWKEKSPRP